MKMIKLTILGISSILASAPLLADERGGRIEDRFDRRGDRIENRMERKGDRINGRLDRRGD
ncbi:hypothetical protein MNBD_GAMMA21-972, partial [hydrothermal vent metagenome]